MTTTRRRSGVRAHRRATLVAGLGACAITVLAVAPATGAAAVVTPANTVLVSDSVAAADRIAGQHEPPAQFTDGPVYVAPRNPPATDIGVRQSQARSLVAPTYGCPGFGEVDDATPVSQVLTDRYTWGEFPTTTVGDGSGDINWRTNPHKNPSWYMWLHSLRWTGQAIIAGAAGDAAALEHVKAIAHDWVRDNPYSWHLDLGAYEATQHRTNVLICLRQAIVANTVDGQLPAADAWIDAALNDHARFLIEHWSGAWNHGTDESIVLFGVGCLLSREDYRDLAVQRLAAGITTNIDPQGATNEQATAYGLYNYLQWGRAESVLRACNTDPGTTIGQRRALLATWLAHATNAQGILHQIGDSQVQPLIPTQDMSSDYEYAATGGASGAPASARVAVYDQGYVFGRTGWGTTGRSFAQESTYSIRFGPRRAVHGHNDHMGITYTSRGRDIIVDSGHAGYQNDVWRQWVRSQSGHSVLTAPTSTELLPATQLTRTLIRPASDFYEFRDSPASGVTRTRGVLFLKDPDILVTLDRASATRAQQFQTLWHLPSDQVASVYSRTTATAQAPGDTTRTILFQIPYRQALPRGAILLKDGQTSPIQGWHYPDIWTRNAAPTLVLARSGTSASILSVIAPVEAGRGVLYTVREVGTSTIIDLTVAGKPVSVQIAENGRLFRL